MGRIFTLYFLLTVAVFSAQEYWTKVSSARVEPGKNRPEATFRLNFPELKSSLKDAPLISEPNKKPITVLLPTLEGTLERFDVYSFPVVAASLAQKFDLNSYIGKSVENPEKTVRFSVGKNDFQSMIMTENGYEFISPIAEGSSNYRIHPKSLKNDSGFFCSATETPAEIQQVKRLQKMAESKTPGTLFKMQSSDRKYRTLRLAISVTGEYTQYFGSVEAALQQINATLTRVNGIFERDLALHLNLIDNIQIIYTDPNADPYSPPAQIDNWNWELQKTLTAVVGEQNYDIGHLFGASGGGGNSGCFGCVCVSPVLDGAGVPVNPASQQNVLGKGSGISSPANGIPRGDAFDLDFVIHEMGHQLGAYHTFSYVLEGTGTNVEPGSGSTLMGYAGITDADVQQHSDPYFHVVSIQQIQQNLLAKTCDVEVPVSNSPPILPALPSYTIPKSTAFVLSAQAVDAEGDALTYTWEQTDDAAEPIKKINLGKTKTGASFRSVLPSENFTRYFPALPIVLAGKVADPEAWEATSSVARPSTFTITARDNHFYGAQTSSSTQNITVGEDGPFEVVENTVYAGAKSSVLWDTAGTESSPYNVDAVRIDYTTDNGQSWTVLTESTPNDGTENSVFDLNLGGKTIKVRVSAIGNVFYAVGSQNVATASNCDQNPPTPVSIGTVQRNSAQIFWQASTGNQYVVRYRLRTENNWTSLQTDTNSITLNNLLDASFYEVQVAKICNGITGNFSESYFFQTQNSLTYCVSGSEDSSFEYISKVRLNSDENSSGASTYSDFTNQIFELRAGSRGNMLEVTKGFSTQRFAAAATAFIDFNRNGIFESSEKVMHTELSLTSPVRGFFDVPEGAVKNQVLRMRIVLSDENSTTACGNFLYGETEDYSVIINPEPVAVEGVVLYPNPVEEVLTVLNVAENSAYKIYNLAGQLMQTGNLNRNSVEVSVLSTGAYVIWLKNEGQEITRKFLKK